MKKNSSTFLITGGAGFIGSHLAAYLLRQGHGVVVYDNLSSGKTENLAAIQDKITFIKGDILDFPSLKNSLAGIDGIFHLAALVSVPLSVQEPALTQKINVEGTLNVLKAAREQNVPKVVLASSSAVYGNNPQAPYAEDASTACLSPYAFSKLAGEKLCQTYHQTYGLSAMAVRYFNVFGPRQNAQSAYAAVIAKFIQQALQGQECVVDWDGQQTRDFIYVEDVARATLAVMQNGQAGEIYNVGSAKSTSLLALIQEIEAVTGKPVKIRFAPKREADVRHSLADTGKIRKLGFEPKVSLKEGLQKMILGQKEL